MLLYHGTSESVARRALKEGLRPRSDTGVPSLWERTVPSNPNVVYLTSSYPGYFAGHAAKDGERWAIIEVDIDELDEMDLHPDEDALEQGSRQQGETGFDELDALPRSAMKERTLWFRDNIDLFQDLWERSLEGLGTVGHYGAIPPKAILRVSFYDPKSSPAVTLAAVDTMVSLVNHKFLADRHSRMVSVLMGDSEDPAALLIDPRMATIIGEDAYRQTQLAVQAVEVEVLDNRGTP